MERRPGLDFGRIPAHYDIQLRSARDPVLHRGRKTVGWKGVFLTAAVFAVAVPAGVAGCDAYFEAGQVRLQQTSDQEKAALLLRSLRPESKVRDIIVVGEEVDGEMIVRLRNRPRAERSDVLEGSAGEAVGSLKRGIKIKEAIVVWGYEPSFPSDAKLKVRWLAFVDPRNPKRVVFAHAPLFEGDIYRAPVYNVSER